MLQLISPELPDQLSPDMHAIVAKDDKVGVCVRGLGKTIHTRAKLASWDLYYLPRKRGVSLVPSPLLSLNNVGNMYKVYQT